ALPAAMDGYLESLRAAAARGQVAAARQVEAVAAQAAKLAEAETSFFTTFTAGAQPDGAPAEGALATYLSDGAAAAREAYARLADVLRTELAPQAPTEDAVGRERYELWSRYFLGARVDLDETYEWGLAELDRIVAEQEALAEQLYGPGVS